MSARNFILLFVLYGGPAIAALLFLALGHAMARTRLEVVLTAVLAGALVLVQLGELWFLRGLRLAWGGEADDPLVLAGVLIALAAAALTFFFLTRGLKRVRAGGGSLQ